ncbi:MAG: ABC transporter permease [Planctomycetota bacterium]
MSGWLELALRYVAFHRWKTALLVLAIFLTALLPATVRLLLNEFERNLLARASATPLVVGPKGSGLDLTLHALHFRAPPKDDLRYGECLELQDSGRALALPLYQRFTASRFPVVGTSLEYLEFRRLKFAAGRSFALLGECVLGSDVAAQLQLGPGDQLLSDRENVLDIAGLYPLKLQVAGVLAATGSADDRAVFVDLKTAWVIAGLGHGHQDLSSETDEGKVLARTDEKIVASAAVLPYTEITDANRDSFHFHGAESDFPITAMIVVPRDQRAADLLTADYVVASQTAQILSPRQTIEELLSVVFRVQQFFDANAVLVFLATGLLLVLVVLLSLKLRADEMRTMFKLGCSRATIGLLQFGELAIVFLLAGLLLAAALGLTQLFARPLLDWLLR